MTSFIYFVSDGSGAIKIGFTTDLDQRMRALKTGSARSLFLIGTVAGDRAQERQLHLALADYRMSGEWFTDCATVRSVIGEVLSVGLVAAGYPSSAGHGSEPAILSTLAEAKALVDVIVRCTGASLVDGPKAICGVSRALLWKVRFRPNKDVYADELSALRSAALRATEVAILKAQEDREWVLDICAECEARDLRRQHLDACVAEMERSND